MSDDGVFVTEERIEGAADGPLAGRTVAVDPLLGDEDPVVAHETFGPLK